MMSIDVRAATTSLVIVVCHQMFDGCSLDVAFGVSQAIDLSSASHRLEPCGIVVAYVLEAIDLLCRFLAS